jgi:MIP family channel proteins
MVRTGAAELVGTFVLVFVGTAAAVLSIIGGFEILAVALAFGLVLVALVAALGHVSGCHLNPAVTIGLAVSGRFPWRHVPVYVGAQCAGAVLASLAVWAALGSAARDEAYLATTGLNEGVSLGQGFLLEALITFVLVLVVVSVATDDRAPAAAAPMAVGFALAVAVLIAGPLTGGSVNPARSIGPALVSGELDQLWLYLLAPVVGGVLAAKMYDWVLAPARPPS